MSSPPGGPGGGRVTLTGPDRLHLLREARAALAAWLDKGTLPPRAPQPGDPSLPHHGVFVSVRHGGELRGCIGNLDPSLPLAVSVRSCAVSAATDPRFEPLEPGDLEETRIEISVLGPPRAVGRPGEIRTGTDGLRIRLGGRQGLLLPQVASERGWEAGRFLEEVCRKAGLPPEAWASPGADVVAFQAEVFGEETGATEAPPDPRC